MANRRMLTRVMQKAGFIPISNEWWHFDALQHRRLRARYAPLDVALSCAAPSHY
jgi:D-alanyl-D-alanine dipeptidase